MVELPIIEHTTFAVTQDAESLEFVYLDRAAISKGKESIFEVADALEILGKHMTSARTEWVYLSDDERQSVALRIAYKLFA